jgi:hypothetical protein
MHGEKTEKGLGDPVLHRKPFMVDDSTETTPQNA